MQCVKLGAALVSLLLAQACPSTSGSKDECDDDPSFCFYIGAQCGVVQPSERRPLCGDDRVVDCGACANGWACGEVRTGDVNGKYLCSCSKVATAPCGECNPGEARQQQGGCFCSESSCPTGQVCGSRSRCEAVPDGGGGDAG